MSSTEEGGRGSHSLPRISPVASGQFSASVPAPGDDRAQFLGLPAALQTVRDDSSTELELSTSRTKRTTSTTNAATSASAAASADAVTTAASAEADPALRAWLGLSGASAVGLAPSQSQSLLQQQQQRPLQQQQQGDAVLSIQPSSSSDALFTSSGVAKGPANSIMWMRHEPINPNSLRNRKTRPQNNAAAALSSGAGGGGAVRSSSRSGADLVGVGHVNKDAVLYNDDDDDDDDADADGETGGAAAIDSRRANSKGFFPAPVTDKADAVTLPDINGNNNSSSSKPDTYRAEPAYDDDDDEDGGGSASDGKDEGCLAGCGRTLTRLWRQQVASLLYLFGEVRRQPRSYALGWFVVFIVVLFIAILVNAVVQSPLIFYRLSEIQAGETDLIAYPGAGIAEAAVVYPSPLPLIDQELFTTALGTDTVPGIRGATGRWLLLGQVKREPDSGASPLETANVILLGINSTREAQLGLGRTWTRPPIPAGEVYLSRAIVKQLQLAGPPDSDPAAAVGAEVILAVDPLRLLAQLAGGDSAGGDVDWTNMSDAQTQALLTQLLPAVDWARVYTTPLFTNGTVPAGFTFSQSLGIQAAAQYTIAELQQQSPETAAALDATDSFTLTLTLRQLNDITTAALAPPFTVRYPNGGSVSLSRAVPRLFPDSDTATVAFPFAKNASTGAWSVDTDATDSSFAAAIATAGSSATTQGQLVTFALPVVLGAARVLEPVTVGAVLGSPDGKFAENVGAVAMMEAENMLDPVKSTLKMALQSEFDVTSSPGSADLSLFVNNTDLTTPGGDPLQIAPLPVTLPLITVRVSLSQILVLAGVPEVLVPVQIAVAVALIDSLSASAVAPTAAVQMTGRQAVYLEPALALDRAFVEFTNTVAEHVGVTYPARFLLPLLEVVRGTLYIRYFLDNIFNAVIALIVFLGALLVFSLLLNDVETKTYEYGMLRALGMRKSNLLQILLTKAFLFSVLGVGTGLFVAFLVSIPITDLITGFADVSPDYRMSATAAIVATVVGIVMPLAANTVPIMRALSKTLRDSLDVYHHVVSEVTVTVVRLADLGLDLWQTAISLLLVSIGFITFYLIPLSFLNSNIPMFLGLLMAILLSMLLGLALLAQIIQPFLERGILWVLMRPFHSNLNALVSKSLSAHRPRNAKTAQMFTIALAFIVFAGVMFALQGTSLADNMKILIGAPIVVKAPSLAEQLNEAGMKPFLDAQVALTEAGAADGVLTAYSFVSFRLAQTGHVQWTRFNNLADTPQQRQRIYGVQESYYRAIYNDYYEDVEANTGGDPAVVGLFTQAGEAVLPMERLGAPVPTTFSTGLTALAVTDVHTDALAVATEERNALLNATYGDYIDAVCSEGLRLVVSIDTETAAGIRVRAVLPGTRIVKYDRMYFSKVRGMARHVPGFFFSSYPTVANTGSALIREDQFLRLLNDAVGTDGEPFTAVPKERLMLNVKSSATSGQRDDLVAGLRAFFTSDDVTVTDTESLIESTDFALNMLNVFFVVVGVLAMLLCFLILWLSFTANVQENAWEFGVLRAVGLNAKQVVLIYVYEALALVLACIILGTTIGLVIAVSLTLQFNLFTEVRFKMEFPFTLYFVQFGLAIAVAVVASVMPAHGFVRRSIAEILRRT